MFLSSLMISVTARATSSSRFPSTFCLIFSMESRDWRYRWRALLERSSLRLSTCQSEITISPHWLVFTAGSPGRGTQQGERKLTDSSTPRWRRGEAARVSSGNCDKSESIKVEYNVNKEVTIVLSKLINERRFTTGLI